MTYAVSITQEDVYTALSSLIQAALGLTQQQVLQGLPNRSAMPPASPGFVVMQLFVSGRLRTNIDTYDPTNPDTNSISLEQGTKLRCQLDLYGATSGDWAVILSTILRDEVGCVALEPVCDPLYTSEPTLAPLDDDELQYEQRWNLDAYLQYNPVVSVPMQFADTFAVTLINVDEAYPP
jgi:hypothetical protein